MTYPNTGVENPQGMRWEDTWESQVLRLTTDTCVHIELIEEDLEWMVGRWGFVVVVTRFANLSKWRQVSLGSSFLIMMANTKVNGDETKKCIKPVINKQTTTSQRAVTRHFGQCAPLKIWKAYTPIGTVVKFRFFMGNWGDCFPLFWIHRLSMRAVLAPLISRPG